MKLKISLCPTCQEKEEKKNAEKNAATDKEAARRKIRSLAGTELVKPHSPASCGLIAPTGSHLPSRRQ